jgi:sugar O-acyltransferase (sialic acid O-acetyltransferase NeuD family)
MSRESYAVFGASGFGREVMPLLAARVGSIASSAGAETFFVDDHAVGPVNGRRVVRYDDWIRDESGLRFVAIAVADSNVRRLLARRCEADRVGFVEVRASNVIQMDSVEIGPGAILCPFVTLTSNIRIGRHFHCNLYSYVAHDCVIGDFVTFAPGVKCNGNVVIEDDAYIGTGAIIKQGRPGEPLVIGKGAVVGMGAVVTRNVPPGATVVGNPARPMVR